MALTINGPGTQILAGANTYTGGTTITVGTLQLGDGIASNGSVAGNINNNATLTFANPNPQTYAGVIGGNGAVKKIGAGALTLSGANTNTGPLTVNGGTVTLANSQSYSSATIQSGTLLLGGPTIPSLPSIPGLQYHLDASNSSNLTLAGNNVASWNDLSGNGVKFTQSSSGSQPTYIAGGSAGSINGLGVVSFNGSTSVLAGSASTSVQTVFMIDQPNSSLYTNLNGIFGQNNNDYSIRLASATSWQNNGGTANGNDFTNGGSMYIDGVVQNGNGNFTADTPQLLEAVSANSNNFTAALGDSYPGRYFGGTIGEVLVYNGTLTADQQAEIDTYLTDKWLTPLPPGVNVLPTTSIVNITGSGATFDLGSTTQTIASLSGVAGSFVNLESETLTIGGSSTTTFAGTMSGAGSLVVGGSGVLTLSGANTYSGGTTINSTGTLRAANGSSGSATGTGPVLVSNGGRLAVTVAGGNATISPTGSNSVTIASGGILAGANGVTLSLTNGLTLQSGAITAADLSGAPNGANSASPLFSVTGASLVTDGSSYTVNLSGSPTAGTYDLIAYPSVSGSPAFQVGTAPSGFGYELQRNATELDLLVVGVLNWTGSVSNAWDISTTANWSTGSPPAASQFINSAPVAFGDGASNTSISIQPAAGVSPASVAFTNNTTTYTIDDASGSAGIVGNTGITMTGSGTVNLAGANAFTGPVSIGSGVINISNNASLGNSSGVTLSGGVLQIQGGITTSNPVPLAFNGPDVSTGALNNVSGNNMYSGNVTLNVPSTISSSAGTLTLSGNVGGNGSLTVVGGASGVVNLAGANGFTGGTQVNSGTLRVSGSLTSAANAVTVGGTSASAVNPPILAGGGSIAGNVTIAGNTAGSNPGNLAPGGGTGSSFNTLNLSNLTLNDGSQLSFNLSSSDSIDNDLISVSGALTPPNGTVYININDFNGSLQTGTYELIGYGSLTGSVPTWMKGNVPAGYTYTFSTTGAGNGQLDLTVGLGGGSATWASNSNATSQQYGVPTNWNPTQIPDNSGGNYVVATFGSGTEANIAIGPNPNYSVGTLSFTNTSTPYTIGYQGVGSLTLDNGGGGAKVLLNSGTVATPNIDCTLILADSSRATTFNIAGGNALVVYGAINESGTYTGQNITLAGGGTLSLEAPNGYTGNTTINNGTLYVGDQVTSATLGSGSLIINATTNDTTSTVYLDSSTTIAGLSGTVSGTGASAQLNIGNSAILTVNPSTANVFQGATYFGNSSGLTVGGSGSLSLNGPLNFGGSNTITVNTGGTLALANSTATPNTLSGTVNAMVASGATLQLAGSVSALSNSNGSSAAAVNNSGTLKVTGTNQTVGVVSGVASVSGPTTYDGDTVVGDGNTAANLTATQILQNSLTINAGSTVTIAPAGDPPAAIPAASGAVASSAATAATGSDTAGDSDPFSAIQSAIAAGAISSASGQVMENRIAAIERLAAVDPGLDASLLESRVLDVLPASSSAAADSSPIVDGGSSLLALDSSAISSGSGAASASAAFASGAGFAGSPAAVPEPSTLLLAALAGIGLIVAARRRKVCRQ